MGRTLVMGDLHGAYRALEQVLERANFVPGEDRLIFLGDVCDGWPDVPQCIEKLMAIGAECIWGNHDEWAWEWIVTGHPEEGWLHQGGMATYLSFDKDREWALRQYRGYFEGLKDYIYDKERDFLYVHGGLPHYFRHQKALMPTREAITWDRSLWEAAMALWHHDAFDPTDSSVKLTAYKKVFIGHTQTNHLGFPEPVEAGGVVMMDQGAGWPPGRLSLMDVDTGEVWQSDRARDLYPGVKGRGK